VTTRSLADLLRAPRGPWVVLRSAGKGKAAALGDLHGLLLRSVDGTRCRTKGALLREVATALDFPAYFGNNWDALEESLNDLEWLPARGYVLVFRHADQVLSASPEDRANLVGILGSTGAEWASQHGKPFHAVLMVPDAGSAAARAWGLPVVDS
jgi:hypothetical protein